MSSFNLQKLLIAVFNPTQDDRVVILVDTPYDKIEDNESWSKRREMASEWLAGFDALSKERNFIVHPMTAFKATGSDNADLPNSFIVGKDICNGSALFSDCTLFVALTEFSASAPLLHLTKKYPILRGASMPGCIKEMERSGLSADYAKVAKLCEKLKGRLDKAISGNVVFSTGHSCTFDLRFHDSIVDNGLCHVDKTGVRMVNLPSGETFQVPYEGENSELESLTRGEIPHRINGQQIVYQIKENRIIDVKGESYKAQELMRYFEEEPARRNIAEFGLGCNDKAIVRGIVLEDEKAGFHWAYGRSDHIGGVVGPDKFSSVKNSVHCDIVYAPNSPIQVETIDLQYKDGSDERIWEGNWYIV